MNPIAIASKGKGYTALWKRVRSINQNYGLTTAKMDKALGRFISVLNQYECGATFPITTATLARNSAVIAKYQDRNVEFAMHGLFHIDYSRLNLAEQTDHFQQARQIFQRENINLTGFRSPYLRWNQDTLTALNHNNLSYDSSQALHWDMAVHEYVTDDYRRVLEFYQAEPAALYPALPVRRGNLISIPYCVPDDEALIDRLKFTDPTEMSKIWLTILEQTYKLGELFTLGLHPERIGLLETALATTLARARSFSPHVWIARLDEITRWWLKRTETRFEWTKEGDLFHLTISGPPGITPLARQVTVSVPTRAWADGFESVSANEFYFQASCCPCIGLSPDSALALRLFLKEQGYWVEMNHDPQAYSIYLDRPYFEPKDKRPLLEQLARTNVPLIRTGRWPHGAQSAMSVTGDIDALTIWDYGLRFLGS